MSFDAQAAIDAFWEAAQHGERFPRAYYDRLSLDDAYRVQLGLVARRCANGERQIGWKLGLTAPAIQEQFGFREPVFGCILDRTDSGHVFRADDLIKPGFEPELCLRVSQDLSGAVSPEAARAAIDGVFPALEITETRGPATQILLALADNAQQKTIVLGPCVPLHTDMVLGQIEAQVEVNGKTIARGHGDAVLGDPVNSLVWLARKLREYDRMVRAGDLIMSGSFTRQFPIAAGERVRVRFSGIGIVETSVLR